jgi:4-aminobutyrate aminotransferase-like enzyme
VAIVQLELIQAVGGVRSLPLDLLRSLQSFRDRFGFLLFVDEVQTGMWRTGSFVLSRRFGLTPDLLTIGKGTSDMMVPFALTLYSAAVQLRLEAAQPELPALLRQRSDSVFGCRTVANVLQQADVLDLPARVEESGRLFAELLGESLGDCKAVRGVRAHGLLIGIELETKGKLRSRLKKQLASFYLLGLLRHGEFPVLCGYCQYEPHVLKLTPPLTITPEEVRQLCKTIAAVLHRPLVQTALSALRSLVQTYLRRKSKRLERLLCRA